MIDQLRCRHATVCDAVGQQPADMTVVFDAGQNSENNFAHLTLSGLRCIGSVPASACPHLTSLPATAGSVIDEDRFGGLTRVQHPPAGLGDPAAHHPDPLTRAACRPGGRVRRHDLGQGRQLDELAAALIRGKTRRPRDKVETEIEAITRKTWVRRVVTWQLTGDKPRDLRLAWGIDETARAALEEEIFGTHC